MAYLHNSYPHQPGTLYDCTVCENSCFCDGLTVECVWYGHDLGL